MNKAYENVNYLLDKSNATSDYLPQIKDIPNFLDPIDEEWGLGEYFHRTEATRYMWSKYKERTCIDHFFYGCFVEYKALNEANYLKVLEALDSEYNPIENYNRSETTTDTNVYGNKSHTIGSQNIVYGEMHTNTSIGSQQNGGTVETEVNPYDSSNYYKTEKNSQAETMGARSDSSTVGQHTDTHSNRTDTDASYTDILETKSNISGNIGTVSTQMMLLQEIELRKQSIIQAYYDNFINQYTFYVDRDDSGYII